MSKRDSIYYVLRKFVQHDGGLSYVMGDAEELRERIGVALDAYLLHAAEAARPGNHGVGGWSQDAEQNGRNLAIEEYHANLLRIAGEKKNPDSVDPGCGCKSQKNAALTVCVHGNYFLYGGVLDGSLYGKVGNQGHFGQ